VNIDPILALDLRPTIKHVMTVLTFRAYEDCYEAHMDYERLIKETCLSRRAVKTAIQELKAMGLIDVTGKWGRGNYNIYTINMEKVREMHPLSDVKGAAGAPNEPEKGAADAPLTNTKGANGAPLSEKNLPDEKGAKKRQKRCKFCAKRCK